MTIWAALGLFAWGVVFVGFWVVLIGHKVRVARRWPMVLGAVESHGKDRFGDPVRNIRLPDGQLAVLKLAEGAPDYELAVGKKLRVHVHPAGKALCERPTSTGAWWGMAIFATIAFIFGAVVIVIALKSG